jgi:tetratricopeptide (TPR) repeat protein
MGNAKANAAMRPRESGDYEAGLALAKAGRQLEAIGHFEAALAARPGDPKVLFALGCSARDVGHDGAAEAFFRQVLDQDAGCVEALVTLANLLRARGDGGGAIALLKPALERAPEAAELWLTLGSTLREAGDAVLAETFYREALRLKPRYAQALGNLADIESDKGNWDEALRLYDKALRLEPDNAQGHLNRSLLLLLKGDLAAGWRDYEYRLQIPAKALCYTHGLKRWSGEVRPGLRLLVAGEQGIGDQIAFASVIPELSEALAKTGGRLFVDVEPRLAALFARSFPAADIRASEIAAQGGVKTASYSWLTPGMADAAIPLGSLLRTMRGKLADFPTPHAFLRADEAEAARWRAWLAAQGEGPFVGICWRSGKSGGPRNLEYAPLECWATFLATLPAIPVVAQYDATPEEIAQLETLSGRHLLLPPHIDQKKEIDRACALLSTLSAVVSAPTAVSWQSAALGVPTFKLLNSTVWTAFGCEYEPLAPAAKPVMPQSAGDWADAFGKAATALAAEIPTDTTTGAV